MKKLWAVLVVAALALPAESMAAAPLPVEGLYKALEARRYDEVEATYAELRRTRARDEEGQFLFERFLRGVYWYSSLDPADPAYWPKVDASTRAWVAHSPKAYLPAMVRAFSLAYHAGAVQAHNGSWVEVDRLAAQARGLMDRSRQAGASDAMWHAVSLRVAAVEGAPHKEVRSMVIAAATVDPYPLRLWQEAAIALSPDGRNLEDQGWLMRLAVQRTAEREGSTMYARVLHEVFWHFCDCNPSPYGRAGVEWSLLAPSFEEWSARYPREYEPNLHGAMACMARDRMTTARLLRKIGAHPRTDTWKLLGGSGLLDRCKEWATAMPESPKT